MSHYNACISGVHAHHAGDTLDASGTGALNFTNTGAIALDEPGARTLTGGNTNFNTIASIIGNGNEPTPLVKAGRGIWTLTCANTYSGTTTLNDGILAVSSLADGGLTSNIGNSAKDASNLVFDGSTLQYYGPTASTDRLFTLTRAGARSMRPAPGR